MSAREGKKPRPHLAESLFTDPWRKLLAFGLAVLLWLFLNSRIVREDKLDFLLQAVEVTASPAERADDARLALAVRVSLRDWTVRGFYSKIDNKSIEKVQLHFEGPRFLIDRLRLQGSRFEARPSPESFTEKSCEFDIRHVHSSNSELQNLLVRMEPRIIKVELERNHRAQVQLKTEHVNVLAPDPTVDPDFGPRLRKASVAFHPTHVTLYGPHESLNAVMNEPRLFEVDLTADALTRDSELMRPLRLPHRFTNDLGISVEDPQPYVTYHLPAQFRTFTMAVPVMVWPIGGAASGHDDYVLDPAVATIQLRASKELESELMVKQETAGAKGLDAWAGENLVLLVPVRPSDPKEWMGQPMLYCGKRSFQEGVHWEMENPPAIKITRKSP